MRKELLPICGPIAINSYGVAIALGILLFIWLIKKHPQAKSMRLNERIDDIMLVGISSGVLGGRLLYLLTEPNTPFTLWNFVSIWDGGFSLLGTIIAILLALTYYLKKARMPILPFLDIIALYTPLLQSASRIGCFLAGCCYGAPTQLAWGVTYTDPQSIAPLFVKIHPTQLYSALALFVIFLFLYFVIQRIVRKPGQLLASYLMLVSIERFTIDFWRDDRTFGSLTLLPNLPTLSIPILSIHQLLALFIFACACILFIVSSLTNYSRAQDRAY